MTFSSRPTTDLAVLSGGVTVLDNAMPGGHLAWTVTRHTAGASSPLKLIDTLSDGQQLDPNFTPIVTALLNGTTIYSGSFASYTLTAQAGGTSQIAFDLQALPIAGADTVTVIFHSVIAPVLASGTASPRVGQGDTLSNSAVLVGQSAAADVAQATLPEGTLKTSIYAVNGVVQTTGAHAALGDLVTYRLQLHLPLSSAQQVKITALPPGVAGTPVFDGAGVSDVPGEGHAQWGPSATYTAAIPTISVDSTGAIQFGFGNVLPVYGAGSSDIDLLFTTRLAPTVTTSAPTLQAVETETNSFGVPSQSTASATVTLDVPRLTIQTASLYSSGANSQFTGSGGPWGFDVFTGQFAGVVSSAGLDDEPFQDQLWDIQAGDQVTFVVAVQNRASRAGAYDVLLRDTVPAGFIQPVEGAGLSVTDGAGNSLDYTGNLFDPAGGLRLSDALASYDPDSGANVALLTFTLQATAQLQVPFAALSSVAQIVSYAALPSGPNLSGNVLSQQLQAATPVTTAGISVDVSPNQNVLSLVSGDQASFDIKITLPEGQTRDLRIDELLPHQANAWFSLVSAQIIHVGSNLVVPNQGTIQPDGSISFGTVTNQPDGQASDADTIIVRMTVQGGGTAAGLGVLHTEVSAADPNVTGARWSAAISNVLPLQAPNVRPTIAGTSAGQNATNTMQVHPFAALSLVDPDPNQVETLTIHLSAPLLGSFTGSQGIYDPSTGNYVLRGSIAAVQEAARSLTFVSGSGRSGVEHFTLTLDDGAGGVATDTASALTIAATAADTASIQHFALSPTGTVLTSTVSGSQTVAQIETYQGPVDYLQSQFIYDGTEPVVIVAQTPSTFIKSVAGSAAIQLLSGQNVVDAGHGSNFLLGGTGQDVFFLDARQSQETWDTIVGFHTGDIATIWGFRDGVSSYWWEESAGAAGFTGRTLRADLTGSGHIEASLTFAGATAADTANFAVTTGSIQGNDYMAVFAL